MRGGGLTRPSHSSSIKRGFPSRSKYVEQSAAKKPASHLQNPESHRPRLLHWLRQSPAPFLRGAFRPDSHDSPSVPLGQSHRPSSWLQVPML